MVNCSGEKLRDIYGCSFFVLPLGEDSQANPVHNIGINNTYEEQRNSIHVMGVNSGLVLPPPPPAVFLGYSLPPGHPCNSFTLPPPPADKKRTGPRRKSVLLRFYFNYYYFFI